MTKTYEYFVGRTFIAKDTEAWGTAWKAARAATVNDEGISRIVTVTDMMGTRSHKEILKNGYFENE